MTDEKIIKFCPVCGYWPGIHRLPFSGCWIKCRCIGIVTGKTLNVGIDKWNALCDARRDNRDR